MQANKPILMTKLKNSIHKNKPGMNFYLRNININDNKKGCSGFIENPTNNIIIYVNTDTGNNRFMYRYADNVTDFSGHQNQWAQSYDELITNICQCLTYKHRKMIH